MKSLISIIYCKLIIILLAVFLLYFTNIFYRYYKSIYNIIRKREEDNFKYDKYQREYIESKIIENGGMLASPNVAYFINGIIRKFKPQKCLEVGVARGGSSALILNAIKDIKNSFLISLDINKQLYIDKSKETGFIVKQLFPQYLKKWRLYTGDQPHKFLDKLNIKFDFAFLDTAHFTPGEIINLIEILPFLNKGAIVLIHDIVLHFWAYKKYKEVKFTPTNIYVMSTLFGEKIYLNSKNGFENIGAVILYPNQKAHYLDYFLLLMSFWEQMPTEKQLNDLRLFIKKYYKKKVFLDIFNAAVKKNKKYIIDYKKALKKR